MNPIHTLPHTVLSLHAELSAAQAFPPEYGSGLSSHLPMALQALSEMGAARQALAQWSVQYSARFGQQRLDHSAPTLWPDWPAQLGDFSSFARFRAHFLAELQAAPQEQVLRATLPTLWPSLSAVALHGLIRVGHAWSSGHAEELACALAYWAARHRPLPPQDVASALPLSDWWPAVQAAAKPRQRPTISGDMQLAAQTPEYRELALALPNSAQELEAAVRAFAKCAAALYAQSRDFTVLHLVTGSRAVLELLPLLDAADTEISAAISQALTAALLTTPFERRIALPSARPQTDAAESIRSEFAAQLSAMERGVALDDHMIKLVHACWCLAQRDSDLVFVEAASRVMHLGS